MHPTFTYLWSNQANGCQRGKFFEYIVRCRRVRLRRAHLWGSPHRCRHLCSLLDFFSKLILREWNTARVFEFYLTYGNHKQLGDAILFDGEWQWNSIFFDQHFAVCSKLNFVQKQSSSSICREIQLLGLLLRWVWFVTSIFRYQFYLISFIYCHKWWKWTAFYS